MSDEISIAIARTSLGNVGWVMTPDFEALLFQIIDIYCTDPDVVDEMRAARADGLRNHS